MHKFESVFLCNLPIAITRSKVYNKDTIKEGNETKVLKTPAEESESDSDKLDRDSGAGNLPNNTKSRLTGRAQVLQDGKTRDGTDRSP